jgi:hypothetical protein
MTALLRVKATSVVLTLVALVTRAEGTLLQDKGIYLAGPFPTPDIHHPPSASAEAVFLAGSTANAPYFLNELIVSPNGSQLWFSDNGWLSGNAFAGTLWEAGSSVSLAWNLAGSGFAITYISVNFNNNFYHVYSVSPSLRSDGQISVTGNLRDVISHIHFFGVRTVPETGMTAVLLLLGLSGLAVCRRGMKAKPARPESN